MYHLDAIPVIPLLDVHYSVLMWSFTPYINIMDPRKMADLIVIGLTCTVFFKVLAIFTQYLYFILPFDIDITFKTHSLFTVMLICMNIYNKA